MLIYVFLLYILYLKCSNSYLNDTLKFECWCSFRQYVENYRVRKAIEIICTKGTKNVYDLVGYKTVCVFSKTFSRVTGFNIKCFYDPKLGEYKGIILNECMAECPRKAIKLITNNDSIKTILLENKARLSHKIT